MPPRRQRPRRLGSPTQGLLPCRKLRSKTAQGFRLLPDGGVPSFFQYLQQPVITELLRQNACDFKKPPSRQEDRGRPREENLASRNNILYYMDRF